MAITPPVLSQEEEDKGKGGLQGLRMGTVELVEQCGHCWVTEIGRASCRERV